MTEKRDKLLSNAGGLLMAAGGITAFTGGTYGLAATRPGLVVLSVLLLMGYGVVGYLLVNRGARDFPFVLPATALLVLGTLFLLQGEMRSSLDDGMGSFVLLPALTLLLCMAGGALATHVVETMGRRVDWPGRQIPSLQTVLHIAAFAPIWNGFALLSLIPNASAALRLAIIGGSAIAAILSVLGAYAAVRRLHPAWTLLGGAAVFAASVGYLFQFMLGGGDRDIVGFGQFNSLLGLILGGLPMAIAAVACVQLANGEPAEDEPASA